MQDGICKTIIKAGRFLFFNLLLLLFSSFYFSTYAQSNQQSLNLSKIEQLTTEKGKYLEEKKIVRVNLKHKPIEAQGVTITPEMEMESTANFMQTSHGIMLMAELVLDQDQVNPIINIALNNQLNVTALHNHFLWENPQVYYLHLDAMGQEEKLAKAIGQIFTALKKNQFQNEEIKNYNINPDHTSLDVAQLNNILGGKGKIDQGVYKIEYSRTTHLHGYTIGAGMDVDSWISLEGTNSKAVAYGEISVTEDDLQKVLHTLVNSNIKITAIHNHMTNEQPRIIFIHIWSISPALELAKAYKKALDQSRLSN